MNIRFSVLIAAVLVALVLYWIALIGPVQAAEATYDYPFADPYVATVIGTPRELQAEVPERIDVSEREVTVYLDRPVTDILWYGKKQRFAVALQNKEAPLIFLIPGMGNQWGQIQWGQV